MVVSRFYVRILQRASGILRGPHAINAAHIRLLPDRKVTRTATARHLPGLLCVLGGPTRASADPAVSQPPGSPSLPGTIGPISLGMSRRNSYLNPFSHRAL